MTNEEFTRLLTRLTETVKATVKSEIKLAVQPLQDQIDELRGVDKRHDERLKTHSGTHKDLATNVRQSLDEVKATTLDTVAATLNSFRAEMRAERAELVKAPEAANSAKEAAVQASRDAASVAFDTAQIRSKQNDQSRQDWIRFVVNMVVIPILVAVIGAIAHALQ